MTLLARTGALAREFCDTLAFFTCLVPAGLYSGTRLSLCLRYFVPAGLVVGMLASLAALGIFTLVQASRAAAFAPYLAAFAWLACELFVSRALHWDGLADLADALGSFRDGEAFWQILKDSRIGTFGALALIAVFLGQLLALAAHIACNQWAVLLLCTAWSRGMAAIPMCLVPPHNANSLGGKMAPGGTPRVLAGTLILSLLLAWLLWVFGSSLAGLASACAFQAILLGWIVCKARQKGGISGDFAGATIELSQLCLLLCAF